MDNSTEQLPDCCQNTLNNREKLKNKIKMEINKKFTIKTLYRRLPILNWIQHYSWASFSGDFIAGFTVGLMIIPQALAYGIVAGLSPSYGLYSAFMGCFVYFFLGSTQAMNIGPTAIMSLMTLQYSSQGGADYAVLLGLVSGILEILAAVFNIGFLINFISQPVISGFTSAAAFTIASSQLKSLFGLKLKTKGLLDTCIKVIENIHDTRYQDLVLGINCIILLTLMKNIRDLEEKSKTNSRILKNILFFTSVGRNAIIVIIATIIAFNLDYEGYQPFTLTGFVESGVPKPQLPPFSTTLNNKTMDFMDIMEDVGVGVVVIPFIAILDHIAIVSAFAKGKSFDATQEIFQLGVTNILGSFFRGIPVTGSLSRTAVNLTSGCKTPLAGVVTGIMVLFALEFLTPFFRYIPKASLAAVIICAVMHMVDLKIYATLWKSKKTDLIPLIITFISCMFWGLEWGILLGIGINLAMLLYSIAKPKVKAEEIELNKSDRKCLLINPPSRLYYPSIVHIRNFVRKSAIKNSTAIPIAIDFSIVENVDFTAAKGLNGTIMEFNEKSQPLIFVGLKPKVEKTLSTICGDFKKCNTIQDIPEVLNKLTNENGIHNEIKIEVITMEEISNKEEKRNE